MKLRNDLLKIGLDVDFTLSLKPYSKSYYGRYDVKSSTIIIYVQKTPEGEMYSYLDILLTTIHEAIHCLQWHDPKFKRVRGVMHDLEFKRLYAVYSNRAKARLLLKEVLSCDSIHQTNCGKSYDHCSVYC